ncbi:MAG: hypothetical protein M1818_002189 [Claussenomyces sp. TS43310]|nr:MAG: hypothetical protein M1818_002189 [Claussenomyces sp. TS43310]
MATGPAVYACFESKTSTWQYIVADPDTREAVLINSVLDFDLITNSISAEAATKTLDVVQRHGLHITKILETHAHADHLTAATYLQCRLAQESHIRPDICIGKRIREVQSIFAAKYAVNPAEMEGVFDILFNDDEEFTFGQFEARVVHLPGKHSPEHVGYIIGDNLFAACTPFNSGTEWGRPDHAQTSSSDLHDSSRRLLSLPPHYRLYIGYEYPSSPRRGSNPDEASSTYVTVAQLATSNEPFNTAMSMSNFRQWRKEKEDALQEPKISHHAFQFNVRAGRLPWPTIGGERFLNIPLRMSEALEEIMDQR